MQVHNYRLTLLDVPADLRADPDGDWTYESLVAAAGLDPEASPPPIVAALFESWRGHPEGAAVIACPGEGRIVVVNCVGVVGVTPSAHERLGSEAAPHTPEWRRQTARSVGRAA